MDAKGNLMLTVLAGTSDLTNSGGVDFGSQNDVLCRLVGVHVARGESIEQIEPLALAWGARCKPPANQTKVRDTVRRIWKKHHEPSSSDEVGAIVPPTATRQPLGDNDTASGQRSAASSPDSNRGTSTVSGLRVAEDDGEVDDRLEDVPASGERLADGDDDNDGDSGSGSGTDGAGGGVGAVDAWPTLHDDALHGLAGDIVKAIAPETEADPAGILVALLVGVGNAVGRNAYFAVGVDRHHANLFALMIGDTASRKGMAWGLARSLLGRADASWAQHCLASGLGSGEGLVERVRDPVSEYDTESQSFVVKDPGAEDKRLLVTEEEFASVFKQTRREGNLLSPLLRLAWDGKALEVLNRRKNCLKATEAHVSAIGQITPDEYRHYILKSSESVNGFSNRFLHEVVRRQQTPTSWRERPRPRRFREAARRRSHKGEVHW